MDLDVNQYLGIFVEESREHLQTMNDVLLNLEQSPEDLGYINEIFRVAHTLKGMSGTMGFHNMANLTHEMENLLEAARSEKIRLTEDVIDVLFECFDALDESVDAIIETGEESENKNEDLIKKVLNLLGKEEASKIANISFNEGVDEFVIDLIKNAEEQKLNVFNIEFILDENCMLKAARAFIIFNELEGIGDVIYSNPSVEDIEDEKFEDKFLVIIITDDDIDSLDKKLLGISEVETINISEFDLEENIQKKESSDLKKEDKKAKREESNKKVNVGKIKKTVRVDIDRLDNLMNLVSELIIIKTRMDGVTGEKMSSNMVETIEYLDRITTSLHEAVMKVRMVPIERVFNRFPRLVRDLSRDLGKEIALEMSGEETEVDRTIIDEIGDPLIHLIRNSLDHGIGLPDDREAKGKPRKGTLVLKAYPDGNNVVIEVGDDGKGIDHEVIRNKAVESGLISEQEAKNLNQEESIALLFEAGLSTSEKVSDVSGRGVGLDVVKSKIESINGDIEINTELGMGSKFIIRIPLTLAIIQALMVELGDEIFAIPLNSITEITVIKDERIENIQGQEVMVYREHTLPIVRLAEILEVDVNEEEKDKENVVVIVKKGDKEAGLIVDDLIGQQEIVIKNLGKYLDTIQYISGATILGDGSISLIIDVNSLI